jgi:uncharacterized membrane protein YphA (DoxX/SURF4 family)
MKLIDKDWTDLGYVVGLALAFGIFFHWSNFIIAGLTLIIAFMIREDRRENLYKKAKELEKRLKVLEVKEE